MIENNKQRRLVVLNSLLLAFFLNIQCLNQFLITFSTGIESVMTLMYMGVTVLIFIFGFLTKKKHTSRLPNIYVIALFYVLMLYFFTPSSSGKPYTSFEFFFVFTVVAYLIPLLTSIDPKILVKATMLLPVPVVLRAEEIFYHNVLNSPTVSMGQSYAFLVPVTASIIYYAMYFKKESFFHKVFGLIGGAANAVFMIYLLLFGSRGPVLAMVLLVGLLLVARFPKVGSYGLSFNRGRIMIGIVVLVLFVLYFISILHFLQSYFLGKNLSVGFIDKILRLSESGDISNGRSIIWPVVVNGFWDSPVLGNGFDLFNNTGLYAYPHNFLFQTIYDGGLLMLSIVTIPSVFKIIHLIKVSNYDSLILIFFLFFISVPGAMFSGDLWQQENLWLFTGMILSNNRMIATKLCIK